MENRHRHHSFYSDAFLGRTKWPFWFLGLVIIVLLYSNLTFPGGTTFWGGVEELLTPGPAVPFIKGLERISGSTTFWIYVFPVLLGFLALILAQRIVRQRPLRLLINGLTNIRWRRMVFAFLIFVCVAVTFWGVAIIIKELIYRPDVLEQLGVGQSQYVDPAVFGTQSIAIIPLLVLPFSIVVDELIFRGYLDQAVRRFISNRWVALAVGACLYALFLMADIFLSPGLTYIEETPLALTLMFLNWFVFGLFLSFLCDHDQGLEAAIGVGIAYAIFQDIAYPKLLPMIMNDNYLETFELPMAAYFHSFLYIPAIILLLLWGYGASRDRFS